MNPTNLTWPNRQAGYSGPIFGVICEPYSYVYVFKYCSSGFEHYRSRCRKVPEATSLTWQACWVDLLDGPVEDNVKWSDPPLLLPTVLLPLHDLCCFAMFQLFCVSLPLGPLITLCVHLTDMRIDARRMLWWYRRPVAVIAQDIGKYIHGVSWSIIIPRTGDIVFTLSFCLSVCPSVRDALCSIMCG